MLFIVVCKFFVFGENAMKKTNKIISILLAALMLLTIVPVSVFAASEALRLNSEITGQVPITYSSGVAQYYYYGQNYSSEAYLYKVTYKNLKGVKEVYIDYDYIGRLRLHVRTTASSYYGEGSYYDSLRDSNKEIVYLSDLPKSSGSSLNCRLDWSEITSSASGTVVTITCVSVSKPVWTWNGTSVTAKFTSTDSRAYVNISTGASSTTTKAKNCQSNDQISYTASVKINGQTYTDTKTETGSAGPHSYTNSKCTYCSNVCRHGSSLVSVDAKTATCTASGYDAYKYCKVCDYTTYVKIPINPDAHDIVVDEAVPSNCNNPGVTAGQHCSRCDNATIAQEEVPALNHKDTLVQVDKKAPGCTEIGWDAYEYCTACSYTTYEEKAALEHDIIIDDAVSPDCYNPGFTAGQHCSRCDDATIAQEEVPALNHKDTLVQFDAKAPTCTEIGWDAYVICSKCNYSTYAEKAIDSANHKWDSGEITTTATCKVIGVKTYTCQNNSNHTYTEKLGADASNHINTKNVAEVKATCSSTGYTAGFYCNDCKKYVSGHSETSKNPSNHVNKTNVKETPATYTGIGYTSGVYCDDCQKYISGHTEIPKLVAKFTSSDNAKEKGNNVFSNNGLTVAQLLSQTDKGAVIRTDDGRDVSEKDLIGTGLILILADGTKKEIVVFGDVDGNGKLTAADARLTLRASVQLENYEEGSCYYQASNIDKVNPKITAADARLILRASVELEDPKNWMK